MTVPVRTLNRFRQPFVLQRNFIVLCFAPSSTGVDPQYPLTQALAACRRVLVAVALFSACVNLLLLVVPMYMLQVYDRVLGTGNVDTLLALSAMAVLGLAAFGLLDNAPILLEYAACDWGIVPTAFQAAQFPAALRDKLTVQHDGVDADFFAPRPGQGLKLPGLDLSHAGEIVTYVARGMEPYRGFPQAMTAFAEVLRRRPGAHVVVVGEDRVAYGRMLPDGDTYKQKMLRELDFDPQRLHFTGVLPRDRYRDVLLASSVHVYLTVPFVLSWSLIEALAAGCAVVASDTAPVREVLCDGENGLLVDFFDAGRIAGRICEVLQRAADGDEGLARSAPGRASRPPNATRRRRSCRGAPSCSRRWRPGC